MNKNETPKNLAPCPNRPNCVSSEARPGRNFIEPYIPIVDPHRAWKELTKVVSDLPRTIIKISDEFYLHAESKSRFFGFIDDIEFRLQPEENRIAVRSASRTGYSDLGVNRKRIEFIRKNLKSRRVIR